MPEGLGENVEKPTETDVINVYQRLLWSPQNSSTTKQFTLMSLTKLSTRFKSVNDKIMSIINSFSSSLHIELQQRGVEFSQLFGKYAHMREALLERMPPMEIVRANPDDQQLNYEIEDVDSQQNDSPVHQTDSVSIKDILYKLRSNF